jgi:hypothetical protein
MLDIKPVDRQVRAVDQTVIATQRHRPQKQPLRQLGCRLMMSCGGIARLPDHSAAPSTNHAARAQPLEQQ